MRTPFVLLKFVAKALANAIGGGIVGDMMVEVLPAVAKDVWDWWKKDRTDEQRRTDIEAVAQARREDLIQPISVIVQEVLPDRPIEVQQAVATYLSEVPTSIRRSLRRPSDPSGTTVIASMVPNGAEDLLRLLPTRLPRFKPGSRPLIGVDWVLEQLLGVGGFGEVWKATNPHLSSVEPVALKFCLDPTAAKILRNEAAVIDRVAQQGKHPGIVQLLHTYLSAEIPCLEYAYIEGGDLAGLILEWHQTKRGPTPDQAARVIHRLAEIVGFAHRLNPPIVHRDLKPANILVQRSSDGKIQFKVADFGIGGVAVGQAIRETSRGTSRGGFLTSALNGTCTPLYASPQQMRGDPPDPRDDVYSLGVIWYQLLTGDLVNGCPRGSRWRDRLSEKGMPSEMAGLLERCFEERPDDRPWDAAELARLLKSTLDLGTTETGKRTKISEKPPSEKTIPGIDVDAEVLVKQVFPKIPTRIKMMGKWVDSKEVWDVVGDVEIEGRRVRGRMRYTLRQCSPTAPASWKSRVGDSAVEFVEGTLDFECLTLHSIKADDPTLLYGIKVDDATSLLTSETTISFTQDWRLFEGKTISRWGKSIIRIREKFD